jgi:predicted house-cleaning noncanonical NTP pyrophosphatase (MazG superfamily)
MENLFSLIEKAKAKAIQEGIKANTVVINENLVKVDAFGGIPTMICGLDVGVSKEELPDNYLFSVIENPEDTDQKYNKVVRDKIPEKIRLNGGKPKYRVLSVEEFRKAIKAKLLEEVNELLNATTRDDMVEELADIMEVLGWVCKAEEITEYEVITMQHNKYLQNGGFFGRIFLESVEEN